MALTKIKTDGLGDSAVTSAKINDGSIANDDLSSSAAIATSKIAGLATSATTATLAFCVLSYCTYIPTTDCGVRVHVMNT